MKNQTPQSDYFAQSSILLKELPKKKNHLGLTEVINMNIDPIKTMFD